MIEKITALYQKYEEVAKEVVKPEVIADNKKYTQLILVNNLKLNQFF